MGDVAARILDLVGIVLNRNTIPGDRIPRSPSGIRLGTPWITQRGLRGPDIEQLAEIIARVLKATKPFAYAGRYGPVYRAKVDFDVLEQAKWDVVDLAHHADLAPDYVPSGYPHHFFMHNPPTNPEAEWDIIEITGPQNVRGFCNVAMTNDVYTLEPGESQPTWILEPDGRPMSGGVLKRPGAETTRFQLLTSKSAEPRVVHWFRALSDGYVHMDDDDVFVKAPGPVVIRRLSHQLASEWEERPPDAESFDDEQVGWAFHKPYWIGQRARSAAPGGLESLPPFTWKEPEDAPLRHTTLYDVHRRAGAEMVPSDGWEMPLRYTSTRQEHQAVREVAGLFDVSHMGLFEFSGDNVHLFLNTVTTNDVSLLDPGKSQYSYLLDPTGHVVDDVWVYRLGKEQYWMVVNAANVAKDWAWVNAVRKGCVMIDPEQPWSRALGTETVVIRDMGEVWVQLALQGPRSRDILLAMLEEDDPLHEQLLEIKRTEIIHGRLAGYELYLSRTGNTGEPMAFEIFVHPAAASALWYALLEAGGPCGLQPAGLDARDSLRIEAGLPLYGYELAGPLDLNPADAGFSSCVKLYKPFFVGKAAYMAHELQRRAGLIRFRLVEEHARMPSQGDIVVSREGHVVGAVTSCCIDSDGRLTGLSYVQSKYAQPGTRLGVFQNNGQSWASKPLSSLKAGDRVQLHDDVIVVQRFLDKKE
jgi:glycine hydroxymethyltransferase